jgi:hypothetical protein
MTKVVLFLSGSELGRALQNRLSTERWQGYRPDLRLHTDAFSQSGSLVSEHYTEVTGRCARGNPCQRQPHNAQPGLVRWAAIGWGRCQLGRYQLGRSFRTDFPNPETARWCPYRRRHTR